MQPRVAYVLLAAVTAAVSAARVDARDRLQGHYGPARALHQAPAADCAVRCAWEHCRAGLRRCTEVGECALPRAQSAVRLLPPQYARWLAPYGHRHGHWELLTDPPTPNPPPTNLDSAPSPTA